ncbi:MAG: hypothetical protein U9R54_00945 [Bacteroidota bacterium]|nr:hypothetical protein [Bacteroidota bacterium]
MKEILELLKYTVPAIIVFLTSLYILKTIIRDNQKNRRTEIIIKNQSIITPIRLQAYERLSLFLERISIESLVMRTGDNKSSAKQIHTELLKTIRDEYNHNVSQQVYVSLQAWEIIKNAKVNTVKLITDTASKLKHDASGIELKQKIIERLIQEEKSHTNIALNFLKKEIGQLF